MMRCKDVGGWGDTNVDDEDDNNNLYRSSKQQQLTDEESRQQSRYVSQFANKVRHDADQCKKACWSSMGLPTTELDGPSCYLRKFSRQLPSHVSVADFLRDRDRRKGGTRSRDMTRAFRIGFEPTTTITTTRPCQSVHQRTKILPNHLTGNCSNNKLDYCYLLNLHRQQNNLSGQKRRPTRRITPLLVRNKKQNFCDTNNLVLPSINQENDTFNDENNNNKLILSKRDECRNNNHHHLPPTNYENKKKNLGGWSISDRRLLELACRFANKNNNDNNNVTKKNLQDDKIPPPPPPPSTNNLKNAIYGPDDDLIDKRNIRTSIHHLLSPNIVSCPTFMNETTCSKQKKQNQTQQQHDIIKYLKNTTSQPLLRDQPVTVTREEQANRDICDNFIIQKLLELRGLCPPPSQQTDNVKNNFKNNNSNQPLSEKGDTCEVSNNNNGGGHESDCYNGKVDYIERGEKNFILENALKCTRMPAKINKIIDRRMIFKEDYGQVPEYIKRRKAQLEDEKEILSHVMETEANRRCRRLTDDERTEIIDGLNRNWEDLFLEFQKLPLFSSSPRVIKRKAEIEAKLRDLESDLRLMSRHGRLFVSAGVTESPFLWQ